MLQHKPIPAIFLYKEASGASYIYNILDGKQRLESLILFMGNKRKDMTIATWNDYFFRSQDKKDVNFWIGFEGKRTTFEKLADETVRNFGEYVIPVIEITLDETTTLDDIISLFVDINQQGVAVKRFDIVKAMCQNAAILKQSFDMIAIKQKRREDLYYKMKNNDMTFVLKRLSIVAKAPESNSRVDRMWERLLEIAIFSITFTHKKPVEILKGFINSRDVGTANKLDGKRQGILKNVFGFLKKTYSKHTLKDSKLATDSTHFYTVVTALIKNTNLIKRSKKKLINNLIKFARILDDTKLIKSQPEGIRKDLENYLDFSSKHTTDVARRQKREDLFYKIIDKLK